VRSQSLYLPQPGLSSATAGGSASTTATTQAFLFFLNLHWSSIQTVWRDEMKLRGPEKALLIARIATARHATLGNTVGHPVFSSTVPVGPARKTGESWFPAPDGTIQRGSQGTCHD
jgi:hypothetical protein